MTGWQRVRGKVARLRRHAKGATESASAASAAFLEPIPPAQPTTPPGPTVVLLNDCRDQINFGADVLVDGVLAILARSLPSATIQPIPSHWLTSLSFAQPFVNGGRGLHDPTAVFPALADQFETVADEWLAGVGGRDVHLFLEPLEQADLVVLNGEGSLYRNNVSAIRELFLAWLAKERLGVPTVFVNGMVHLTGVMPVLPAMVRKTFRVLDAVAVRDAYSCRNLAEYMPELEARLFPDSAFVFTRDVAQETPAVTAVRASIGDAPYFCFDPGAMPIDARGGVRSGLFELIARLTTVVPRAVLINSGPADAYIEKIAALTDSVYVDTFSGYREYMALAAQAEFAVSGRYHNPILAAIVGCPTIALASTSHKVHGACEMLGGLIGTPYDGTDLRSELDAIERQARDYLAERATIRDELLTLCQRRRTEAFALGDLIAAAVPGGRRASSPRE